MPSEGDYRKLSDLGEGLKAVAATAEGWAPEQRAEAQVFVNSYTAVAENQRWFILNCDEIREEFGVELGDKIISALDS